VNPEITSFNKSEDKQLLIGFLTPLEAEYKTFGRHKGKLRTGEDYTVKKCGVGKEAKYAAENLIKEGVDLLIGWGVGGSMTRQLNTGDLLISSSFKDQSGAFFEFQTHFAELLNTALSRLQPKRVEILTVEKMVLNQREKAKLIEKYQTPAVDMESVIIAQTAKKAFIPYICVRTICDEFEAKLPGFLDQSLKNNGEANIPVLFRNVILNPSQALPLLRLGWDFRRALRTLKQAASLLIV
tara:strand:- start:3517 stop:4236 length:720 start_codon:yes stop_codon:yes gene_type:complete